MGTTLKDSPVARWVRAKATEVFGADLRSLATFRIVLAVLVLVDLASRSTNFYAHYTDEGAVPLRPLWPELQALYPWTFSLNVLSGEPFFQALVFGVAALAALGLLVGYRTRLATVVVWVMVLVIQWRNPWVLSGADQLLGLLLFWGMFLPLGAYWSVDHARKAAPARLSTRFLSLATVGLFMQISFMYWFTAIEKSGPEWRADGTALYYALSIDMYTTPIGDYLLQFPTLLEVMTFATLGLEAFGPFLLFSPVLTGPVRTGAALAFMGLTSASGWLCLWGSSSWSPPCVWFASCRAGSGIRPSRSFAPRSSRSNPASRAASGIRRAWPTTLAGHPSGRGRTPRSAWDDPQSRWV